MGGKHKDFGEEFCKELILDDEAERLGTREDSLALFGLNDLWHVVFLEVLVFVLGFLSELRSTAMNGLEGWPITCMMRLICSCSLLPANMGSPR